uniref:Dynein heavy chain tail domain-containing protein n=1 Tax=Timema cristinae TaxID=61476 RepID=A0A7R9CAJ7_TIMCR|nr:unnamed protein product [Timema cristinae]
MFETGVKSDFCTHLHSFLAGLTDLHYKMQGLTVIYVPQEGNNLPVEQASRDKELIKRLEGVVVQWTHQIRVALSDRDQGSSQDMLGPTDEHSFWIYRYENLAGVDFQLKNKHVKHICDILHMAQSTYIKQFVVLVEEIKECMKEAKSNIEFLQILNEPCAELETVNDPSEIHKYIPKILHLFRVIWLHSPYYNSRERLSDLCRAFSNQIILQCCQSVDLPFIFKGNSQAGIKILKDCIECCVMYKLLYEKTARLILPLPLSELVPTVIAERDVYLPHTGETTFLPQSSRSIAESHVVYQISEAHKENGDKVWVLDEASIFNHVDSFCQRCKDLIEVCDAMIIFGRMDETQNIAMPSFGGTRGEEFEKVCENIEKNFNTYLQAIKDTQDTILDVQVPTWYDDILRIELKRMLMCLLPRFRSHTKELEVVIENLMDSVFEIVQHAEEGLHALQAFYHYSKRSAVRKMFDKKTVYVYKLFEDDLQATKKELVDEKEQYPASLPYYAGRALMARLKKRRLERLMKMLDDAEWLPYCGVGEEVRTQFNKLVKTIDDMVMDIYHKWIDSLDENMAARLNRPLLCRSLVHQGLLESNFDR